MTERPPDEPEWEQADEDESEFDRFEALTKRLLDAKPKERVRLDAVTESGERVPAQHFEVTCPGCGEIAAVEIGGLQVDPDAGPFDVREQADGRYVIECHGSVVHVCDYGRGGGSPVPARPSDRPPSGHLGAEIDEPAG